MEKIQQPLRDLLSRLRLHEPMTGWQAVELWAETVGDRIAAHTRAASFRDGTLIVEVDSTPWMNELTYLERRIKSQLNQKLGDDVVRTIRLRPAGASVPQPRKRHQP
jgi:predicted nucleic acid-binding Zn ribbon protein